MERAEMTAAALPRLLGARRRSRPGRGYAGAGQGLVRESAGAAGDDLRAAAAVGAGMTGSRGDGADLPRIAALVHALCDRDGVPVPGWVWKHRSRRPIGLTDRSPLASDHEGVLRAGAPSACAYHRVWFDPASIEDHRVHGFTRPS